MAPANKFTSARPRTSDEVKLLPTQPSVLAAANELGVQFVVHFTTMNGVVGVFAAKAVKSRARLHRDEYLEHVYKPNANTRKDELWLDYVNLSIERINDWMFDTSSRWHATENNSWVLLSFAAEILAHPGVVFATTNNIYPACVRAEGLVGFKMMFADRVTGRYGQVHDRLGKDGAWPTDRQAEVLYPGELSCQYLRRVDVQTEAAVDTIHGMLGGLGANGVEVRFAPEVFK